MILLMREIIDNCPDPRDDYSKFISYLKDRNDVVAKTRHFFIIKNIIYSSDKYEHNTIFPQTYKRYYTDLSPKEICLLQDLLRAYAGYHIYINSDKHQSIEVFHMHVCQNQTRYETLRSIEQMDG